MKRIKRILSIFLTAILALSCFSATVITANAAEIDSSSPSGSSIVEYSIESGWKATIPAYVKAADQGQYDPSDYMVTIYDVLLGEGETLVATIDYDGILSEENGIELQYSLYDSDGKIEPVKRFAEIPAGDPDEIYTYNFGAALDEKPKYAGNYLGTVMFNLFVEDIYYTAEDIEKNPLLYPIGQTVPEYVIAEFDEDYSSVTIFKNGKESDGLMKDFDYGQSPMSLNSNTLLSAVVSNNVKNIGVYGFQFCYNLQNVTIGAEVESISKCAFLMCSSLTSIIIPDSVVFIGERAFQSCDALDDVSIPAHIETIGSGAFEGTSIISVTIPDSAMTLEDRAFSDCTSLKEVSIGNGITSIKESTFARCTSLISITIPENVKSIERDAFAGCDSLMKVTFEGDEITIYGGAFAGLKDLVIYGRAGSTAEAFAQANGYTFIALSD